VDKLAINGEVQRPSKTHQVESGGVLGKFKPLPGEISRVRALEKSAEAVVAKRPGESREERRAKERRNKARQ
jgi:hypothetical protein